MRIAYLSDAHWDFYLRNNLQCLPKLPDDSEFDILVIAGDVANGPQKTLEFVENIQKLTKNFVLYVPGNHCRYHSSFEEFNEILSKFNGYMNRKVFDYQDQRFVCFTNWYPILEDPKKMNDYRWPDISWIGNGFPESVSEIDNEYHDDYRFLYDNLKEGDIVVSHFLPCDSMVQPKWVNSNTNAFYVSDKLNLIKQRKPKAWIFGHTHERFIKYENDCLFMCNPVGYPGENPPFKFRIYDTEKDWLMANKEIENG